MEGFPINPRNIFSHPVRSVSAARAAISACNSAVNAHLGLAIYLCNRNTAVLREEKAGRSIHPEATRGPATSLGASGVQYCARSRPGALSSVCVACTGKGGNA